MLGSGPLFSFLFLVRVRFLLFLCPAAMGGRRSGSPSITHMSLGTGSGSLCVVKAVKMGALSVGVAASRCHSPSSCMQWDRKYKTYTHCRSRLPAYDAARPPRVRPCLPVSTSHLRADATACLLPPRARPVPTLLSAPRLPVSASASTPLPASSLLESASAPALLCTSRPPLCTHLANNYVGGIILRCATPPSAAPLQNAEAPDTHGFGCSAVSPTRATPGPRCRSSF